MRKTLARNLLSDSAKTPGINSQIGSYVVDGDVSDNCRLILQQIKVTFFGCQRVQIKNALATRLELMLENFLEV